MGRSARRIKYGSAGVQEEGREEDIFIIASVTRKDVDREECDRVHFAGEVQR